MSATVAASVSSSFVELCNEFPPRPIRDQAELDRAIGRVDAILDRSSLSGDEKDYLFVLGLVIEDYEKKAYPREPLTDAELLKDLLEEKGITQTQLAARAGITDSTISAILAGKRQISKGHIAALVRIFEISPALFFRG